MDEKNISRYLLEVDIFRSFCAQVQKDFETSGLDTSALGELNADPLKTRNVVHSAVRSLASGNNEGLRRLLYRVDISEKQLATCQGENPTFSFDEVVTELIVKRVLQKVILRKKMSDG